MGKERREQEAREAHRKRLRQAKRRRQAGRRMERKEPEKVEKPTILIVCEGVNTEVSYFRQFKLATASVVPVGVGAGAVTVFDKAVQLAEQNTYDFKACVFDKDDVRNDLFNEVVAHADAMGFITAWSNQAFEYWFLLHLIDHQGETMHRREYNRKINEQLKGSGISYDGRKTKMVSDDLFDYFEALDPQTEKPRVELAIERSERIMQLHLGTLAAHAESCTCVHRLVKKLLEYR